ncbi:MAG: hypothetical protein M1840_000886 [Geoglossum simile]|nr:MAG: hypothetical protein M1840_000886 [Geoglossum simile]
MIKELADYESAVDKVQATEESLLATLSFAPPGSALERGYARTMLIFDNNEPAGMALYFYNYSTWTGRPGIYLEDLFVRPPHRRKRFGQRLLRELAAEVLKVGGARLDWSVMKWNEPSINESIGAKPQSEWMSMRVDGEALVDLAKGGKGVGEEPEK